LYQNVVQIKINGCDYISMNVDINSQSILTPEIDKKRVIQFIH